MSDVSASLDNPGRTGRSKVYLVFALLFFLIVTVGFSRRYWLPLIADGVPDFTYVVHLHAVTGVLWTLLFFTQVTLIRSQKLTLHRMLGLSSIVLALLLFATGMQTSVELAIRLFASDQPGAREVLLINSLDMILFAGIYSLGLVNRTTPHRHKRLMLLAAIVLMNAATFRIGALITGAGLLPILLSPLWVIGMIAAATYFDRAPDGRVHEVYKRVGGAVVVIYLLRIPIMLTPPWIATAEWIMTRWPVQG